MTVDLAEINIKRGLRERLTPDEYHLAVRDDAVNALRRLRADGSAKALRDAVSALLADNVAYRSASYRVLYDLQDRIAKLEAAAKQPRLRGVA